MCGSRVVKREDVFVHHGLVTVVAEHQEPEAASDGFIVEAKAVAQLPSVELVLVGRARPNLDGGQPLRR
jgi:hypothetical protein